MFACTRRPAFLTVAIVVVALLVVGNLCLIFGFSSESREESGARSRQVTEIAAHVLHPDFGVMSPVEQEETVESLHHIVRKTAHFSEFALLGVLTALLVQLWGMRGECPLVVWIHAGIPAGFCLLAAISDETYQIWTNRGASAVDVCIDFGGAVCGVLILRAIVWMWTASRRFRTTATGKEGVSRCN